MAKATRVTKEVTRTVVDKVPDGINLHLTEDEAKVLIALVGRIVGPIEGARGKLDNIYYALNDLGIVKAELKRFDNIWIENS